MMKTQKQFLMILGLAAVSLLASCNKDNNGNSKAFIATTEQMGGTGGSRSHINPANWNDGTTSDVLWTAYDKIRVANMDGAEGCSLLTFQLSEGAGTNKGTFLSHEQDPDENFFDPGYVLIYPMANANNETNTISGNTATFKLPSTQSYKANTFDEKAMPMVATSSDQTLQFKNVLGGLCFPLVGDNLKVTRVELTSKGEEALWGTCTTTIGTTDEELPSSVMEGYSDESQRTVILDCSANGGVTLNSATPTHFCILVPPGSLESGFTVKAYNNDELVLEKSTTQAPGAGFIPRSVIRKVNSDMSAAFPIGVTTISPTYISKNSAKALGELEAGATPDSYGILYALASDLVDPSTNQVDAEKCLVVGGTNVSTVPVTSGSRFEVDLTGLEEDAVYYVRAYTINDAGVLGYGDPIPFATRYDYFGSSNPNPGRSRNVFSVSSTKKVYFSMGNLQFNAQGSSLDADGNLVGGTWRFAEYQFECIGEDNNNISSTYDGWIDLFCYGTSGWHSRATGYLPYSALTGDWSATNYYSPSGNAHGSFANSLTGDCANADWGVYNAISNGGNTPNQWRTPQDELIGDHTAEIKDLLADDELIGRENYRFAAVILTKRGDASMEVSEVNGVPACGTTIRGLIVFPDNFVWPSEHIGELAKLNVHSSQGITEAQWSILEQLGCIFLPAGGYRYGNVSSSWDTEGYYWSSTCSDWSHAVSLSFHPNQIVLQRKWYRNCGRNVRLVRDVTDGN